MPEQNGGTDAAPLSYDYIIAGSGCAGLSLAVHMIRSGSFRNKRILLADRVSKTDNDRTWCMWEQGEGIFQNCVYREWRELRFFSEGFSKDLQIAPYTYKLIRGIDFYNYCIGLISAQDNFTVVQGEITGVESTGSGTWAEIDGNRIYCTYLFNSILFGKPALRNGEYWLLQHFKGWVVKAGSPAFNADRATLMDFRTDQSEGTTFFYVLPFSDTEALVEYTLFSKDLLPDAAYDAALHGYITNTLQVQNYSVPETEF
jgi:lycopene beta-cyclase